MSHANVTKRASVQAAIDEFERLGRDAFLRKYGYGPSRKYFIAVGRKLYDSKAILGAAHGYEHGEALRHQDFSGGELTVARRLQQLGFEVSKADPESQNGEAPAGPGPDLQGQHHFVVYHNTEAMGRLAGREDCFEISTSKPVESLRGNRIWLLSGEARPRRYFLNASFVVDHVESIKGERFLSRATGNDGFHFDPALPIDTHPWFAELKRQMGNFGFGMQRVTDRNIINALQALLDSDHPTAEDAQPTVNPATLAARARRLRRRGIPTRPVGQIGSGQS